MADKKNRSEKYNKVAKVSKRKLKKEDKVPEGYKKVEVKPVEMPKVYKDPKIKYNMHKPYIENEGQYKSMEPPKIKKYIIERKLLDAIKEIFKKPLSLRKLKFIRYLFLPVNRLIKS